jgi:hypothetical protein
MHCCAILCTSRLTTRDWLSCCSLLYSLGIRLHRRQLVQLFFSCYMCIHYHGNVFTKSLTSNDLFWLHYSCLQVSCHTVPSLFFANVTSTPLEARRWQGYRASTVTDTDKRIEELLDAVFSMRSVPRLHTEDQQQSVQFMTCKWAVRNLYC